MDYDGYVERQPKSILTLSELADAGILRWRNRATVRKYVAGYPEIFKPKLRGSGRSKRYVIERKNAELFMHMMASGELKGFKRVRANDTDEPLDTFITIVSADGTTRAADIRSVAENIGYRTDLILVRNRREFMGILGKSVSTHDVLILVLNVKKTSVILSDGSLVMASEIKRIKSAKGVSFKTILLCVNSLADEAIGQAFQKHGARSVQEISGTSFRKDLIHWLSAIKEEGIASRRISARLHRRKSSLLGRRKTKVDNRNVKRPR